MSKKVVRRHSVEHAETIVFIVWEPHGDFPGRVQKQFFSRARCEGAPIGISKRIWADFLRFGCLLGVPGAPIFRQKSCFFSGLVFGRFLNHFWITFGRGRRQGRGLSEPEDSENLTPRIQHALLPLRDWTNLTAAPLPPAPSVTSDSLTADRNGC